MAGSDDSAEKVRHFPKTARPHETGAESPQQAPSTEAPQPTTSPATPQKPANDAKPAAKKASNRRFMLPIIIIAALAGGGWYGYNWFTVGRFMVSTDDAYVGGDITTISPKVSGYVASVNVVANQQVKAGDPLVTLDNGDYRIAADQAQAQIDTENLTLKRINAQIDGAKASVTQAQAQKTALVAAQHNALLTQQRATQLSASSVGTQANLDTASAALDQANANVAAGDAAIAAATANIAVLEGQYNEAQSSLKSLQLAHDKAERDLSFTVLKAPYDGVVGNLAVQKGDLVSVGARLAAIVPSSQLYIDANFKETQLSMLVPGEKVNIHVDAIDGDPIVGTIASVSPASGSVFSLLPAENATGNFTKVVQRVPVRIAFPKDALATGKLRAGLSVTIDADTRTIPDHKANAQ
jgi:membrane fusion protein (multidrug efflux system)